MSLESARRINETMHTPGWQDIAAMLNAQAKEPLDELYEIMIHKTAQATGNEAFLRAGKAKALRDFMDSLQDEVKLLPENAK